MIIKYKQYNESIKSLLVGPTKEDISKSFGFDRSFDTPEEFFLNVIDGMVVSKQTKSPNSIYYEKNGRLLFEIDYQDNTLHVNNDILSILRGVFNFETIDIRFFIRKIFKEYLNINNLEPQKLLPLREEWWEKYIKNK